MKHSEQFSLNGQVALVLGGSSGIGRQIALGFHDAGAVVVPVGKTAAKVAEVEAALAVQGAPARGHCADVTRPEELTDVVTRTLAQHGRINILVNSQGLTILKPAEEFSRDDYDLLMATNLTSVFFACTEIGRHMLERGSGSIVNTASLAAHRGFQLSALYTMSKHGVLALTRTLAAEWATRGVRVNAISPGFFMTALNRDKMSPTRKETAMRRTPMKRFGELDAGPRQQQPEAVIAQRQRPVDMADRSKRPPTYAAKRDSLSSLRRSMAASVQPQKGLNHHI